MKIIQVGETARKPLWIGVFRCMECESIVEFEPEDARLIHQVTSSEGKAKRIVAVCPICRQWQELEPLP